MTKAGHQLELTLKTDALCGSRSSRERLDLLNPVVVIGTISSLVGRIPVMHYFSSYVVL